MRATTFDDVVQIMEHRKSQNSALITEMLEVRRRYHADYVIPIPDMDDQPELPPLTPALVANAIDLPALTASQVIPDVFCPPLDFTKPTGKGSREYARKREHAIKATWYGSKMQLQNYRLYRHLSGYATSAMLVRPRYSLGMPFVEVRDPLTTYPEPKANEDLTRVGNCGFVHQRSASWLRSRFPACAEENGGPVGTPARDEQELWDIVEWWDDRRTIWGILGPSYPDAVGHRSYLGVTSGRIGGGFLLQDMDHGIGHCPVVTMPRITLDKVATQVSHNLGIIDFMGKLLMLDMIAAERNVFPDRWAIGNPNESPVITSNGGKWVDGRTGDINLLSGVSQLGEQRSQPDPMTRSMIDTLERNFKVSTGSSSMQAGENTHNLRTGRAIAELYGVAVDPRVMELQRIVEFGLAEVNESILACWENLWPDDKVRLFAGFQGNRSVDELRPAKHIEGEHRNAVSYTIAGADVQQTTIALGQLYGTDAISLDTMRRKHPYIDDPEVEARLVNAERIERTMYASLEQRAAAGELPLPYLAKVAEAVLDGKGVAEAVAEADEMLREEQARQPEPPAPESGLAAPPEAMPGIEGGAPGGAQLAELGAGPQPQGPPIGPTGGQEGLAQLLQAMRAGGAA